jgi:hypothetical protein
MVREIILVEIIVKDNMSTEKSRAFIDSVKAEDYFKKSLRDDIHLVDEEDIEYALDNGFYDLEDEGISVSIKEIYLEED